ncbi:MAG: biopolymer transporter ExbD, partial [Aquificaceae bacterium]
VFFMVYTLNVVPMLVQDIRLPSSTTVERKDVEESIKVYVKKDGTVVLENRELGLDALRSYLKGIRDKEKASVLIIADKDAQVQRVIDVIDVLKEEGISKVGLSGEKK